MPRQPGQNRSGYQYLMGQRPGGDSASNYQYLMGQQTGASPGMTQINDENYRYLMGQTAAPSRNNYKPPATMAEIEAAYAPQAAANTVAESTAWLDDQAQRSSLTPAARAYLMANPDVLASAQNSGGVDPGAFAWSHYVKHGRHEGRDDQGLQQERYGGNSSDNGGGQKAGGDLRTGGFIVPADVVSALGNGSTDAGLELLMQKFKATPIDGPGDGMSDSIPTTIEGKQRARVARGEAYLSPEQVQRAGGTKKLYDLLDRIRQNAHGKTTQQRQINPNKVLKA
jgi:hypothetical protein